MPQTLEWPDVTPVIQHTHSATKICGTHLPNGTAIDRVQGLTPHRQHTLISTMDLKGMQCTPGLMRHEAQRHNMSTCYMYVNSLMQASRVARSIQAKPEQTTYEIASDQMLP